MHWIALPLPWCDEPAAIPGAAMQAAAAGWWALRFTPRVALVDGDTVLLEVSTTERLWGGRDALLAQGYQLQSPPPDSTAAFFRSEVSRMARLVKQSGLKLD